MKISGKTAIETSFFHMQSAPAFVKRQPIIKMEDANKKQAGTVTIFIPEKFIYSYNI